MKNILSIIRRTQFPLGLFFLPIVIIVVFLNAKSYIIASRFIGKGSSIGEYSSFGFFAGFLFCFAVGTLYVIKHYQSEVKDKGLDKGMLDPSVRYVGSLFQNKTKNSELAAQWFLSGLVFAVLSVLIAVISK